MTEPFWYVLPPGFKSVGLPKRYFHRPGEEKGAGGHLTNAGLAGAILPSFDNPRSVVMRLRTRPLSVILILGSVGWTVTSAIAAESSKAGQLLCPVSGEPAKLEAKAMTADGPVFFCCDGCRKKFEADPAKYQEQVTAQRAVLAHYPKVQETCPVSGKPVDKQVSMVSEGRKVYFCCKDCAEKFKADPAKFKGKLAVSYTYQDFPKCPVSGRPVDFSRKLLAEDGPVYFCCGDCQKKYEASPAGFAEKVAAQRKALALMDRIQVYCPVSGKPVTSKQFVEKDGQKIKFCCADCKAKFEKDSAAYSGKMEGTYTYQTRCPVMEEDVGSKSYLILGDGRRIHVCCPDCSDKLKAQAEKYV
ncbi:MAG: hypothetical protein IT199_05370, partial [Solirubrobacterales bacterium]|nr:hypothetical protein [Solirubrobacterales bacterium]